MDNQQHLHAQLHRFRSKKDAWFVLPVCIGFVLPLGLLIYFLTLPGIPIWVIGEMLVIEGGIVALVLGLTYPLYYDITPSSLLVRSGWLRWEVPLSLIQQVTPTHNPLSAPALSVDRLQVKYEKDGRPRALLISPEDKRSFLHALAESTADLEFREGSVVRRR